MFAALYRLACESQEVGLHCSTTIQTQITLQKKDKIQALQNIQTEMPDIKTKNLKKKVVKCNTSKLRTVKGKYM
jgi:hypothetical protein